MSCVLQLLVKELVIQAIQQADYRNKCMRMRSMHMKVHCEMSWNKLRARHMARMKDMPDSTANCDVYMACTVRIRGVVLPRVH